MLVMPDRPRVQSYSSYLALDELLGAQRPRSSSPDEPLFITTHQTSELWFRQLLYEFGQLQDHLDTADAPATLASLHRSLAVVRMAVCCLDALDSLTPRQFEGFRNALGTASGFQSAQFREIEASLGARDRRSCQAFAAGSPQRLRISAAMSRPSVFDSFLRYLAKQGWPVPAQLLDRDVSQPLPSCGALLPVLLDFCRDENNAELCDRLVELDQAVQDWRYRHVLLVQRLIGGNAGTGGTAGVSYLRSTLHRPVFADLWAIRDRP